MREIEILSIQTNTTSNQLIIKKYQPSISYENITSLLINFSRKEKGEFFLKKKRGNVLLLIAGTPAAHVGEGQAMNFIDFLNTNYSKFVVTYFSSCVFGGQCYFLSNKLPGIETCEIPFHVHKSVESAECKHMCPSCMCPCRYKQCIAL